MTSLKDIHRAKLSFEFIISLGFCISNIISFLFTFSLFVFFLLKLLSLSSIFCICIFIKMIYSSHQSQPHKLFNTLIFLLLEYQSILNKSVVATCLSLGSPPTHVSDVYKIIKIVIFFNDSMLQATFLYLLLSSFKIIHILASSVTVSKSVFFI